MLFRNCLDGLSDEQAAKRPSGATNNAAFIAAHLANSRFYLLKMLGVEEQRSARAVSRRQKGHRRNRAASSAARESSRVDEGRAPAARSSRRADRRQMWMRRRALRFPLANGTLLGTLTFLVQHDSYHLGQLSLLRKYCGLPAMRYQ